VHGVNEEELGTRGFILIPGSAVVVIVTTTLPSDELVCPFISLESEATSTIPMSRKGANTPLMTAVQHRAFTGLILIKSNDYDRSLGVPMGCKGLVTSHCRPLFDSACPGMDFQLRNRNRV